MKGKKLRRFVGIMSLMLLVMLTVPIQARAEDEEDDTFTSLDRKYEYRILDPDANTVEITAAVPRAITTEVIEDERVRFIPETIDDKWESFWDCMPEKSEMPPVQTLHLDRVTITGLLTKDLMRMVCGIYSTSTRRVAAM